MTNAPLNSTETYIAAPDAHLDPVVAAAYDDAHADHFQPDLVDAAVATLAELADGGVAVEFAIGTGRIALPLAQRGVSVLGIDLSEPMLAQLRMKPGAEAIQAEAGDITTTRLCDDARLVYLVFNTIMNLKTQQAQVACFQNAADHLASGGCFVIETMVPALRRLPPGETIVPFDVSQRHLGFEEYVDLANQISVSHHYHINGDSVRVNSPAFRYVWPSELDLMAQLAGLELESRWGGWGGEPFDGESASHVSVWRKP